MASRRCGTVFTFLTTVYLAIVSFQDAPATQNNIHQILAILSSENISALGAVKTEYLQQLN
jgi:hypothetical protein